VTAATVLILAAFGNSPDFWLNVQRRGDLWEAIEGARPLTAAA
jgi:antitoxin HigA-1